VARKQDFEGSKQGTTIQRFRITGLEKTDAKRDSRRYGSWWWCDWDKFDL